MKKILIVIVLLKLLFLIPKILISCSCDVASPSYSFCNSPLNNDAIIAEVVVIEKPKFYDLKVIILDELNLKISDDTILILGQDGLNCGENTSIFEIGDTLILRLLNWEITDAQNNEVYNWYLDGCNLNYLSIKNEYVSGFIREGVGLESIKDFKQNIKTCLSFEVGLPELADDLKIYPNPFTDKILIEGNIENIIFVEVFDINARKIISKKIKNVNNIEIFLEESTTGLYFINMHTDNYVITKKLLKE